MWNINTISKKKRNGSVKYKVSIKNVGNVTGTLTATPVEGEAEEIELGAGDTYILLKEVEKGKNLNTVYSSVEVAYDEDHSWEMVVSQVVNADVLANANITYVATFDTDGGSTVADQNVPYGSKVTRPADPTKQDKLFGGWYTTAELTTEFDFDTVIADDTTIYAKWNNTPAPQLGSTIRLVNNSSDKAFTYVATPTDTSAQAETGTVAVGGNAELSVTVAEGEAVSIAYSSIAITYEDVATQYADLTTVATSSVYVDLEFPSVLDTVQVSGTASYKKDNDELVTINNVKFVKYSDYPDYYDLEGDVILSAPASYTELRANGLTDATARLKIKGSEAGQVEHDFSAKITVNPSSTGHFFDRLATNHPEDYTILNNTMGSCYVDTLFNPNGGAFEAPFDDYANEDGNIWLPIDVGYTIDEIIDGVLSGVTISMIVPAKQGYTFQGWSYDGQNVINNPGAIVPCEPTTLLAVWEEDNQ